MAVAVGICGGSIVNNNLDIKSALSSIGCFFSRIHEGRQIYKEEIDDHISFPPQPELIKPSEEQFEEEGGNEEIEALLINKGRNKFDDDSINVRAIRAKEIIKFGSCLRLNLYPLQSHNGMNLLTVFPDGCFAYVAVDAKIYTYRLHSGLLQSGKNTNWKGRAEETWGVALPQLEDWPSADNAIFAVSANTHLITLIDEKPVSQNCDYCIKRRENEDIIQIEEERVHLHMNEIITQGLVLEEEATKTTFLTLTYQDVVSSFAHVLLMGHSLFG
ncbi:MAG: hypothetical protein EZS28_003166 [Streblomastix strix]|uniref:Uncharacterized protein n=1 Tax=Streblomastix strix TaxID=222440 RepID=A0A5J4X3H8_9EUKA|nr:MAG: hypothetical protein EZS28_003166 [Streblomastix strix]